LEEEIRKAGGQSSSSVSQNTDYLINNDSTSGSSKNKKAKELGIPIITEEEFLKLLEA
ncbi:BRCT domain-containing protein, partial [Oribacterium sinus]